MKKCLSIILIIAMIFSGSVLCANSETSYNVSALNNCNYLYTYNGDISAYLYGYDTDTLYSAKIFPAVDIRYVSVQGKIRSVSHNSNYAYALYEDLRNNRNYHVVRMNMNNGNCSYFDIGYYPNLKNTSFSVSNNEIFLINTDSHNAYVMSVDFNGNKKFNYRFDDSVTELFINNEDVYAHLYGGKIYKVDYGTHSLIADVNSEDSVCNAGVGYIYTDKNSLYSIGNNYSKSYYTDFNCIVKSDSVYYADGNRIKTSEGKNYKMSDDIIAIVSSNGSIAAILSDYSCEIIDKSVFQSGNSTLKNNSIDTNSSYFCKDNVIYGIESGTLVSNFIKSFSVNVDVYDNDNNLVTSGKMKTGYLVTISGDEYYVAVQGDITGEGNVKSNDITSIMSFLSGKSELKAEYYYSADFNYDGTVDNRDMVLIAQKYESDK